MNPWTVAQQLDFASLRLIAVVMVCVIMTVFLFIMVTAIASRPIARHALGSAANRAALAIRLERIATPQPTTIPAPAPVPDPRPAIAAHNAFLATHARRGNRRRFTAVA